MFRTLVVPLDGSPFAEQALPVAVGIARRSGAAVRLVHVLPPVPSIYGEAALFLEDDVEARFRERRQAEQQAYLDRVAGRVRERIPGKVTTALGEGEVADLLLAEATRSAADLVVMTTHGRGPLGRFWLGSVADELVRRLPVPLLLARPQDLPGAAPEEVAFRHILLTLDGTPLAERMVEPAVALGALSDAEFTLLRVIRPVPVVGVPAAGGSMGEELAGLLGRVEQIQEQLRQEAATYLEGVAGRLRARGLRVQTRVAVDEQPGAAVVREAADPSVDLVALATHGRRGVSRLLLGSVADKVIRGAARPVLAFHPAD
jgi:nucleotide-binding universal stress UspA family protein